MSFSRTVQLALGLLLVAMTLPASSLWADALCPETAKTKLASRIPLKATAFDLRDVRLLEGPFRQAQELDHQYLLSLDVDSLLHTFRLNAGLPSSASPLGGWEAPEHGLRGGFVGHYLSACALMYASTGDERLKAKGDALVAGLAECQAQFPSGYLSAFPESWFDAVDNARPVNVAYYFVHKVYAGLLDMYVYCDNPQALAVYQKAADWVIARNAARTDEQLQQTLQTEHGGMNEVLANLYAITGEEKYRKIAERFNHTAVLGPAAHCEDCLTGLHANTQIPKFVGTARQYELTGEDWYQTASRFFWDTVVKERSYVIGGHSDSEMFSPKETLSEAFGPNTTETCNTYNMLKLTRHLFCWEPRPEYADFYERALLNHILSSQNPADGMMCYYVPLRSGSTKVYSEPLNSFWCCTGTGIENHAKYGDSIYFHDGAKTLFVNLFIASELNWKALGIKVRQETRYPEQESTRLVFTCEQPTALKVHVRHPWWATAGFEIRLNGQSQNVTSQAGEYATLQRTWANGDTLEISMPFTLRTEGFRDNPQRFAFLHGPLVLAAEVAPEFRPQQELHTPYPGVVAEDGERLASLRPVAGEPSTFEGPAEVFHIAADASTARVRLEPFYKMHGGRHYVVYWNGYTPATWSAAEAQVRAELEAERAREQDLKERTVDAVDLHDPANEQAHHLQGEKTATGVHLERSWRHASDGGWFSWDLKVAPDVPQQLHVTYWGSDVGREFDILLDGTKLTTQTLQNNRPEKLYEELYDLPAEQLQGKPQVTVRFQGRAGGFAGGVFDCRVVKRK